MSQEIPDYEFSLNEANLTGDFSSLATIHNKNMKEIEKWMRGVVSQLSVVGDGNQVLTDKYFELLLSQNRTILTVEENLQTSDSITTNGYKLIRIDNPIGLPSGASELVITDMDSDRRTNFRKKLVSVMNADGDHIYPLIRTSSTMASIIFSDGGSLDSDSNGSNKKHILIS